MKLFGSPVKHHCTKPEGRGDPPFTQQERDMHYLGLDIGGTKIAAVVWMRMAGRFAVTAARRKSRHTTICLMRCGAYRAD